MEDFLKQNQTVDQKARIAKLILLITRNQDLYYGGESEISDAEFDTLWDELKILDPKNPILKKIGSDLDFGNTAMSDGSVALSTGTFEKARHVIPMGSQEKAANPAEFEVWATKMSFDEFIVEYKLDGASLELQYENGKFLRAVTRGDGEIGDDISRNVRKMKGFVENLADLLSGGVRAEVIMTHDVHTSLYADKANCRNAANGLMKRKDGTGSENLQIVCYDAWFSSSPDSTGTAFSGFSLADSPFSDEVEKLEWLVAQGFETAVFGVYNGVQAVIDYRAQVMELRQSLNYDIDGLVVKGRTLDYEDVRRARPEKQIACKFSLEEAISIVRSVIWSESGATYTPIAEFDIVELAGTKVQRASLVNPNTIRTLKVEIGSHVVVTKRGEIIPKIERVVHAETQDDSPQLDLYTSSIIFPTTCNTCGTTLTDEGTRLFCPNVACAKRIHHRIEKWVNVLDIRDFGVTLIKRLYETERLTSISDIYTLTEAELSELDRLGSKSATKIVASIQGRRTVSLAKFIAGFDIENIGETLIEKLSEAGFDTLDKLFIAKEEDIASVHGFAQITARGLCEGLFESHDEMLSLTQSGTITIKPPVSAENVTLAGKSFCFTGELHAIKRSEAETLVKEAGGSTKSSVVKGLSFLVTNDASSGSSKNKKANEMNIPIIDEQAFLKLLNPTSWEC